MLTYPDPFAHPPRPPPDNAIRTITLLLVGIFAPLLYVYSIAWFYQSVNPYLQKSLVDKWFYRCYTSITVDEQEPDMKDTLYTVAGYSRGPDGKVKFRVANDIKRAEVLARNGHTEVSMRVLPIAMTRVAAEQFLNSQGAKKELGGLKACVERAMSAREAKTVRAEFCLRVREAYEAN
jgi:hypothetical protein